MPQHMGQPRERHRGSTANTGVPAAINLKTAAKINMAGSSNSLVTANWRVVKLRNYPVRTGVII